MGTILIAMPKEESSNHLVEIIKSEGLLYDIEVCRTASDVLRISNERDFGLIICTKQIMEMSYIELAGYIPEFFGMILLTKDATSEMPSEYVTRLILPLKKRELLQEIATMSNLFERRIRKKKKAPPRRSKEEQKLIDEAKALLMEQKGMTEPEAFRYIQKSSMDTGRGMVESAQMVLMLGV